MMRIPDRLPLSPMGSITIMRCTVCGAILPGLWGITRRDQTLGVDHVLDEHRADLLARRLRAPLFVNCTISDPCRIDEPIGRVIA